MSVKKIRKPIEVSAISTPVQIALDKMKRGEQLTEHEDDLLLTPQEVAEVLSFIKGSKVSSRYIPQMLRDGRLEPDSLAGGHAYRYKMNKVREVKFRPAGRPVA